MPRKPSPHEEQLLDAVESAIVGVSRGFTERPLQVYTGAEIGELLEKASVETPRVIRRELGLTPKLEVKD